ncbi:MAG: hypothetical protein H6581_09510 [Bacteroidia bacterium]|nr:hypothetical protein [Bacteroidia bacterium]
MKKISLILFLLTAFSVTGLSAQSLNFSRVVNIAGDCTGGTRVDTVPAGKIWKIEGVRTEDVYTYFSANGSIFTFQNYSTDSYMIMPPGATGGNAIFNPVWLNSNAMIKNECTTALSSDYYFYSILEFEVVP